ncbi:hypothetical protein LCGC14_1904310 [marine sediment metagenome]|uniref:SMODS and SLOG-associating 2TM effector domain-containing protein n=1 Tax=marine sediment metagenome TaxID=412755 RepID=A0A0F9ITR4_9ZZZZ
MHNEDFTPIRIERASEQLRQEREAFDQRKKQASRWFTLRLVMGYVGVIILTIVIIVSTAIILNPTKYPEFAVATAVTALLVDVIGIIAGVWKFVLSPDSTTKLKPETQELIES